MPAARAFGESWRGRCFPFGSGVDPFLHVFLGRKAGVVLSIRDGEELVLVRLVHDPGDSGSQVVRKIKLLRAASAQS